MLQTYEKHNAGASIHQMKAEQKVLLYRIEQASETGLLYRTCCIQCYVEQPKFSGGAVCDTCSSGFTYTYSEYAWV